MVKLRDHSSTTMNNDEPIISTDGIQPCVLVCVKGLIDVTTPMTLKSPIPDSIFLIGIKLSPYRQISNEVVTSLKTQNSPLV